MLESVFGGPVVQLVEYSEGKLLYRAKRSPKVGSLQKLRVAGLTGKPVKVKADVTSIRALEGGGFLGLASVPNTEHRSVLAPLQGINRAPDMRRHPRVARRVDIRCTELVATSVDISTGGMQVETGMELATGQTLWLTLIPGLRCKARVAWVQGVRAGLEFRDVDDATELLLSRFAEGRVIPTVKKSTARLKYAAPPDYES